ncbi:DUF262 domain-containing HNH endonuclease family protein [Emcibacter sp.]|uniref:DUF262 domain-containing protein n=1 Tax=Emcibacter sp. TaxID=1979954 RepID=UPI002AA60E0A|nr:DUF262 domain-containing HNH endonuclease family protein [Emcibacter sp.]
MKIESKDIDIDTLLAGSFFHIPRFQRPYSWDEDNINEFWEDLIRSRGDEYFIGSMVVFKKAKQQYGIVDGQQRLTTITILLCVIRDAFNELGCEDLSQGIHQLIERTDRENKREYVLLTETSFPYFQEVIQKFEDAEDLDYEIKEEEKYLKSAHEIFKQKTSVILNSIDLNPGILQENKLDNKRQALIDIRDSVLNLNIIFITLEKEDDAYLIFETLNTRGKDLALTDLVKNHFFKHMKKSGSVDHMKIRWNKLLDTIHQSSADISTDTFIYHFWASRYESVPLKKLFPVMRKTITRAKSKDYLEGLVSDSKIYRSIHEPSFEWKVNEREVSRSLEAMQLFKLSQPIPAVLSLVRAYRSKTIKLAKLRDTLRAIENFHFKFTAVTSSRSSGGISAMYNAFAQKLFEANDSQTAAAEIQLFVNKLRDKVPVYDEFVVGFRQIIFTNTNSKQKNLVRYILEKISTSKGYKYSVDYADLTIEHIIPQSQIDEAHNPEEIIGSLGNLIFVDQNLNGLLDKKPFNEKKTILNQNKESCPSYILEQESWTKTEVTTHLNKMAHDAYYDVWKL